jgi:hypothetical protein
MGLNKYFAFFNYVPGLFSRIVIIIYYNNKIKRHMGVNIMLILILTYMRPVESKIVAHTSQRAGKISKKGLILFLSDCSLLTKYLKGNISAIPAKSQNT